MLFGSIVRGGWFTGVSAKTDGACAFNKSLWINTNFGAGFEAVVFRFLAVRVRVDFFGADFLATARFLFLGRRTVFFFTALLLELVFFLESVFFDARFMASPFP